ncbi:MAG: dephospho-CoA kinase [Aureispira sp.]|nr:dephospho-CoA kinase [Aureispira sp.]
MLKIGITGGIGSGKTTVCKQFATLGIPVYYADDRAKWLMNNDTELKTALIEQFGEETYLDDQLNRAYLANIVFKDKAKLDILNGLVHPAVFKDGMQWQIDQEANGSLYSLKEAALLFETGSYLGLDKIIVVTAPLDLRIARVMKRDNTTREAVLDRINKQISDEEKVAKADFVIQNIELEDISTQVQNIHLQLLKLNKSKA